MKVFLDTGAFLALADEDDDYHTDATSIYTELLQSKAYLFTPNFVLSEKSFDQAGIKVLRVSEAIERAAKVTFVRYDDKDFSFVDCTSFALIDHHRLDHAFAFDTHFRQYRFKKTVTVLPGKPT